MKLYDTFSSTIKELIIKSGTIYICGPTVQDIPHIGHMRISILCDVLIRLLKKIQNINIICCQNITDIDDKIIDKSISYNLPFWALAYKNEKIYYDVLSILNCTNNITIMPRVTSHIDDIIKRIQLLIDQKYAYLTEDGVYFKLSAYKQYGLLSGRDIDIKDINNDFALWKFNSNKLPGWHTVWGYGRPGWHIECSVLSSKYLGESFDIHSGGMDLIFPHHENEIAQSKAIFGSNAFANHWFHIGNVNYKGVKMSKSVGNIVSIVDLLNKYNSNTIRYYLLSTYYRSPIEFQFNILDNIQKIINEINYILLPFNNKLKDIKLLQCDEFINVLSDDLNTYEALNIFNQYIQLLKDGDTQVLGKIKFMLDIFGFTFPLSINSNNDLNKLIDYAIKIRNNSRDKNDYYVADIIRDILMQSNIELRDNNGHTDWHYIIK